MGASSGCTSSTPIGRSTVAWDGELVSSLTASDGRTVSYTRDDAGQLATVSTVAGDLHYAWAGNLLLSVVDNDGVAAFVNEYDEDGRVVRQTSPFGRITEYTYQVPGATVITDERGVRQAMVHDARGNLTAVIDVDGSAMRITYDDADRAVRVVSKSGAEWRYDFDDVTGDLLARHDPDGLSQSWTWDELARPLTDTDRTGATTTFEYDGSASHTGQGHRPRRRHGDRRARRRRPDDAITDADGVVRSFEWDRDGQLSRVVDAHGATTSFEFDAAGLLVRLVDAAGVATTLDYDRGRVVRSERGDAVCEYSHTPAGRINGGIEPGDLPWSATFGPHGAMETITDALGSTAAYEYDSLGDVTAVIAPDGAAYRNEFDEVGRLISASDPAGGTLHKGYDVEGRLVEFVDPDGRRRCVVSSTCSAGPPARSRPTARPSPGPTIPTARWRRSPAPTAASGRPRSTSTGVSSPSPIRRVDAPTRAVQCRRPSGLADEPRGPHRAASSTTRPADASP